MKRQLECLSACMRVTIGEHHYIVNSNFLFLLIPCGDARGDRCRQCRFDGCLNREIAATSVIVVVVIVHVSNRFVL